MNLGLFPAFDQVTSNEHPLFGNMPTVFVGPDAPSGTVSPWKDAIAGSEYIRFYRATGVVVTQKWVKVADANADADWVSTQIAADVSVSAFTDGGSTAGTYDLPVSIPIGAVVARSIVTNVVGFAGDTTATLQIGVSGTAARYSTGTPSVFATAAGVDMGAVSGTAYHSAATTPRLTITSTSDFTAVKTNGAGRLTVRIYLQA